MLVPPSSIGIDLIDIARVRRILREHGERFLDHLLGDRERELIAARHDKEQFLAGRFAAKEAAIKALGKYLTKRPAFHALQVVPDTNGQPQLLWSDELAPKLSHLQSLVSISHERNYAIAVVILSEKP